MDRALETARFRPETDVDIGDHSVPQRRKSTLREIRTELWESGTRPRCAKHPDRVVKRSGWIRGGQLKCSSCHLRDPKTGKYRECHKQHTRYWKEAKRRHLWILEHKF